MKRILTSQHYLFQLARFIVIGLVNTIFGLSVFAVCILLGIGHALSLAIATVIGVPFNFQMTGRVVFRAYKPELIFRFALGYFFLYGLNLVALNVLIGLGVPPIAAQALLAPLFAALTFLINRALVFRSQVDGIAPHSLKHEGPFVGEA